MNAGSSNFMMEIEFSDATSTSFVYIANEPINKRGYRVADNGLIFLAFSQANGVVGIPSLWDTKTTLQVGLDSEIGHIAIPIETQSQSLTST